MFCEIFLHASFVILLSKHKKNKDFYFKQIFVPVEVKFNDFTILKSGFYFLFPTSLKLSQARLFQLGRTMTFYHKVFVSVSEVLSATIIMTF